jgi:hypothetical protein
LHSVFFSLYCAGTAFAKSWIGNLASPKAITLSRRLNMSVLALSTPVLLAAAGYSFLYLLLGGGIGGAILIFIVAKMLGK